MLKHNKKEVSVPQILITILIIATIAFAWIHSAMPRTQSAAESGFFLDFLKPFLSKFLPEESVTDHLIRKIAHFVEYGALGFEVAILVRGVWKKANWRAAVKAVYFGLSVALIDETIQIFSERGPQIADVWLDLSGVVVGGAVAWLIVKVVSGVSGGRVH